MREPAATARPMATRLDWPSEIMSAEEVSLLGEAKGCQHGISLAVKFGVTTSASAR